VPTRPSPYLHGRVLLLSFQISGRFRCFEPRLSWNKWNAQRSAANRTGELLSCKHSPTPGPVAGTNPSAFTWFKHKRTQNRLSWMSITESLVNVFQDAYEAAPEEQTVVAHYSKDNGLPSPML
jgi:hypothetical protein